MKLRTIILAAVFGVVAAIGTTFAMNVLRPSAALQRGRPPRAAMPPLTPLTGTSTMLVPAAVAMSAIRDALEARAPHDLAGKRQSPVSQLLSNLVLSWSMTRGPIDVSGQSDALVVATPINGTFQALGKIAGGAHSLTGVIGNLIGGNIGQEVQGLAGKTFDQHADIRGSVMVTSRPTIAPDWRLAPNLAAQVNVGDVGVPIAGFGKLSVANEVKPFLDNAVRDQTAALETRLRNDPFIENAARGEWTKLCRSVPLGAAGQNMPDLWLEIRPVRAIAAQPKIDADAVTLFVGVQAQTRIVPNETKPDCPFPQQLDIVQQANSGTVSIGVPIDIPFTEVSRLLEARIKGKTFPEDGSGSYATTIKQAAIAPSGDRLLISLLVDVKRRGFFSFGAAATVNLWGRPVLDRDRQILRFADVALDVRSEAGFGLVSAAAQAAAPYLESALANQAIIDLKPFAENARQRMAAAAANLSAPGRGISAHIGIDDVRLAGIAYDDKTLRVIADVNGTINVAISSLPMQ